MSAESEFGTLQGVLLAPLEDAFVISLLCTEQVKHDASELVCRSGDGLGFSKLARDTTEELTQIVVSVV